MMLRQIMPRVQRIKHKMQVVDGGGGVTAGRPGRAASKDLCGDAAQVPGIVRRPTPHILVLFIYSTVQYM